MRLTPVKFLIYLLLVALPVMAQVLPARPQGPVADIASVLDEGTKTAISQISQSLWEQAGFSLVVATVPSLGEISIEEYTVKLYEAWGIGPKKTDEGVLIVLSLNPRRCRIEVGYGAEGYLNDAKTGRLLDEYGVPYFKTGDYSRGMLALSGSVAGIVAAEKQITLSLADRTAGRPLPANVREVSPVTIVIFIIVLIIMLSTPFGRSLLFFMLLSSLAGGRRGGFGGGFGGGGFGGGFGGGSSGGGGSSRSF